MKFKFMVVDAKLESYAFLRTNIINTAYSAFWAQRFFTASIIFISDFSNLPVFRPVWQGAECTDAVSGYNSLMLLFRL